MEAYPRLQSMEIFGDVISNFTSRMVESSRDKVVGQENVREPAILSAAETPDAPPPPPPTAKSAGLFAKEAAAAIAKEGISVRKGASHKVSAYSLYTRPAIVEVRSCWDFFTGRAWHGSSSC
jgi:hypothetical protein